MRPNDVREFVQKRPFRPVRLTLTDGRTFSVHHPELLMVGKSTVAVGVPSPGELGPIYDRLITISLLHIMQIETIDAPAASSVSSN